LDEKSVTLGDGWTWDCFDGAGEITIDLQARSFLVILLRSELLPMGRTLHGASHFLVTIQ
jgi:hypothetical protein